MSKLTEEMISGEEVTGKVPPVMDVTCDQRIIETSNAPSKSKGTKMVKLVTEIVKPEKITRDGVIYNIAGIKANYYFPIESAKGPEQTKRMRRQYKEFREMMGVDPFFDLERPEHEDLRGLGFRGILHSEERTPMELDDEGNKVPVKDENGQPITRGFIISMGNPSEIFNRVELDTAG